MCLVLFCIIHLQSPCTLPYFIYVLNPIPGGLWKVQFLAGALSSLLISPKLGNVATSYKQRYIERQENYNFYEEHFDVRSTFWPAEVIKGNNSKMS